MVIGIILLISYFIIGLTCSYHWFKDDYEEEYNKIEDEIGNTERGMVGIILLIMTVLWPLMIIYKIIKLL